MASIAVRLQPKHRIPASKFLLRSLSSSSSSPVSPPASSSNETPASGEDSSPLDSHFADIKSRLRQSAAPPRRIPLNPPKPDVLNASATRTTSIEEIRKHLSGFVRSNSSPKPMNSSSSGNISLMDLFNKSAPENVGVGGGTNSDRLPFDHLRQSFRNLGPTPGEPQGTLGRSKGTQYNPMSLGPIRERLNMSPSHGASGSDRLPHSIFGKELEEEREDSIAAKEDSTEFLYIYSHSDLGEKLRKLRPAELVSGKEERKGSFSLHELNERLVRLRRMEVKQMKSRSAGMFSDLHSSLSKLKEADATKKQTINNLSFLAHLGGHFTPKYLLGEPKEHLVEKYFHPDLMSSEEKLKMDLKRVRDEFKMSESDCGSARVQVAQLTTKIKHLSSVLHKKDKHSQKGLQAMVQRRRKLLKYLRRTDWDSYCFVLSKLGLRDAPDYRISTA